jgi:hypothetical protein
MSFSFFQPFQPFYQVALLQQTSSEYDAFVTHTLKNFMMNNDLLLEKKELLKNEYEDFSNIIINNEYNIENVEENNIIIYKKILFMRDEFSKLDFNFNILEEDIYQLCNDNIKFNLTYDINEIEHIKQKIAYFVKVKLYTYDIQIKLFCKTLKIIQNDFIFLKNINIKLNYVKIIDYYQESIFNIKYNFKNSIKKLINTVPDLIKSFISDYKECYDITSLPHRFIDETCLNNILYIGKLNLLYINTYDYFLRYNLGLFVDDNSKNDDLYFKKIYDSLIILNHNNNNECNINILVNCQFNLACCRYIFKKINELKIKLENFK